MTYASEHIPHTRAAKNAAYNIGNLSKWWGDKKLSDVTARNCRAYAAARPPVGARRDLEVLRAAIGHWHREYGPLPSVPFVVMPAKPEPRDRWLTRSEAARLIKAARRTPHLARFVLLGLYTGSRSGTIFKLQWNQIAFTTGVMSRRAPREIEDKRKRTPKVRLGRRVLAHLRRWRRLDPPETQYICSLRRAPGAEAYAFISECGQEGRPDRRHSTHAKAHARYLGDAGWGRSVGSGWCTGHDDGHA